ncbi:hypothetical protein [Aquimarina sp. 2304DJ70-9]|uniref:hypothetical protein n=1 Tax=Aquimarina penaris TaxID=3231044 RepID=UPI0034624559
MKDSIINDNSFKIKEIPLDSYPGKYKDGKPYEGYFKKGDREFYTVDFYENGEPKYQYSMDILDQMEQEEFVLDIKSTYKDGKIFNGSEVLQFKDGILCKNWNNGKLESFTQDVFAVHYYNRITFEKEKDAIQITNLQEKNYQIKLFIDNDVWVIQLLHKDQILVHTESVAHAAINFPKNSIVRLYVEDNVERGLAYRNIDNSNILISEADLNTHILNTLETPNSKDIDIAFDHLLDKLIQTQGFSIEKKHKEMPVIIGYFDTNGDGLIKDGIRCIENKGNTLYQIYENGKLTKEEKTTVTEFQEVFSNYVKNK